MTVQNLAQGTIGRVQGPIAAGEVINFAASGSAKYFKLGISISEKDLMSFNWRFPVKINNLNIVIGKSGVYEPDGMLQVSQIVFPQGAPASVTIDYVVLDI